MLSAWSADVNAVARPADPLPMMLSRSKRVSIGPRTISPQGDPFRLKRRRPLWLRGSRGCDGRASRSRGVVTFRVRQRQGWRQSRRRTRCCPPSRAAGARGEARSTGLRRPCTPRCGSSGHSPCPRRSRRNGFPIHRPMQGIDRRTAGHAREHRGEGEPSRWSLTRRRRDRVLPEPDAERCQEQRTLNRLDVTTRRQARPPRDRKTRHALRKYDDGVAAMREDGIKLQRPASALEFCKIQLDRLDRPRCDGVALDRHNGVLRIDRSLIPYGHSESPAITPIDGVKRGARLEIVWIRSETIPTRTLGNPFCDKTAICCARSRRSCQIQNGQSEFARRKAQSTLISH